MPDGIFSKALSLELYPNPLMRIAENVVITPLGIVMRIVSKTSIHVCRSPKASRTDRHRKILSPAPAESLVKRCAIRTFSVSVRNLAFSGLLGSRKIL
jgi:hypothetical protein